MKIKELIGTSTFTWSADAVPLLATGSVAGAVDLDFSAQSVFEIWDVFGDKPSDKPLVSANLDDKFCALAWLRPFEGHARGILVGAMENGVLQFWDAERLLATRDPAAAVIHTSHKHRGCVRSVQFNPHQPHVLATGGQHGEIFVWDVRSFAEPFAPGRAMATTDEIVCVAWNNAVSHILATVASGGHASIWDLKAKREVLHLSYNGAAGRADFSWVAWHPTALTKLATCSQSDSCPTLMTWDLRNATEPEHILQGHAKGVLAFDWCAQDPELMLSVGKDNSTVLWNPVTGVRLGEYPSAGNWTFLTRFAPRAPDVFATALFDGKIVVQTLQDTTAAAEAASAATAKPADDNDFWSSVAERETRHAEFAVHQAPQWLRRPVSAVFGFGGKVAIVRTSQGRSTVTVAAAAAAAASHAPVAQLAAAVSADDFGSLVAAKAEAQGADRADWDVLRRLAQHGRSRLVERLDEDENGQTNGEAESHAGQNSQNSQNDGKNSLGDGLDGADGTDDLFFENLASDIKVHKRLVPEYAPTGSFAVPTGSDASAPLARLLLANRIDEAVAACIADGKLVEALVLALDLGATAKAAARRAYFERAGNDAMARLVHIAAAKDVLDVVANGDLSGWRDIAACVAAYTANEASGSDAEDARFRAHMVALGDRLHASGAAAHRDAALVCYVAGAASDKVAGVWLADVAGAESELRRKLAPADARWTALAGFVEKLAAYRSIVHDSAPLAADAVCRAVLEFAATAAGAGLFDLARRIAAVLPADFPGWAAEKDRIDHASGTVGGSTAGQSGQTGRPAARPRGRGQGLLLDVRGGRSARPGWAAPRTPVLGGTATLAGAAASPDHALGAHARHAHTPGMHGAASSAYMPASGAVPTMGGPAIGTNPAMGAPPAMGAGHRLASGLGVGPVGAGPGAIGPGALGPGATGPGAVGPGAVGSGGVGSAAEAAGTNIARPPTRTPRPGNPYAPAGAAANPYTPAAPEPSALSMNASQPAPAFGNSGPTGSVRPPATSLTPAPFAQAPFTPYAASPAPPPAKPYKLETDGWNDLPDTFQPSKPARRAAAAPAAAPASPVVTASPVIPPPPKLGLRVLSKTLLPANPPPLRSALAKYAPPPDAVPQRSSPPNGAHHTPSTLVSGAAAAPPKNPYAPAAAPAGPQKVTYAPPPATTFAPPPLAAPAPLLLAPNPYAPAGGAAALEAPTRSPSRQFSPAKARPAQPAMPPPPRRTPVHLAPPLGPPRSVSTQSTASANGGSVPNAGPYGNAGGAGVPGITGPPPVRQRAARTASFSSVTLHLAPGYPADSGDRSQISAAAQPIYTTFSQLLEQIKPAVPPKYANHVVDMEKRLGILFDSLNRDALAPGTVQALNGVASQLAAKNYAAAAAALSDILVNHAADAGAWHTGVKRLVTMVEAFDA